MPITKEGQKALKKLKIQYGDKRGESVFYSSINSGKKGTSKWHIMKGNAARIRALLGGR